MPCENAAQSNDYFEFIGELTKKYKTICVSKGDTLWNIAKSNQETNGYYKGKDIRYIMNDIAQINNIEKSNLKIDQELLVPVI